MVKRILFGEMARKVLLIVIAVWLGESLSEADMAVVVREEVLGKASDSLGGL